MPSDENKRVVLYTDPDEHRKVATFDASRIAEDREGARRRATRAKSANTLRAYASAWRSFVTYCEKRDATYLPAHPAVVAAFLHWRASTLVSAHPQDPPHLPRFSVIGTAYSAIAHYHRNAGIPSPTDHPQIQAVLEGIANDLGTAAATQKTAVRIADLLRLADLRDASGTESLGACRDWALLLLGFASALRRSNLAALCVEDCHFEPDGLAIFVRKSKTDQRGKGRWVGVKRRERLCPVRAVETWLSRSGVTSGRLFRSFALNGALKLSMSPDTVDVAVKHAMSRLGHDPAKYGAHSLRRGFATDAAEQGRSLKAIMDQGGWVKAETAQGYMQRAKLFVNNPSDILP